MTNKNKLILLISIIFIILIVFLLTESKMFTTKIFNFYCNYSGEHILLNVNTHGEKHVDLCYLYLYKKGKKINQLLESKFLDETTTNIIFNGIQLKKGDAAWALYSDINFSDIFYNELLNRYDYTSGMEFFLDTINNPMLRIEILKKIRENI